MQVMMQMTMTVPDTHYGDAHDQANDDNDDR